MYYFNRELNLKRDNTFLQDDSESLKTDNEISTMFESNLDTVRNQTFLATSLNLKSSLKRLNDSTVMQYYFKKQDLDCIPSILEESPSNRVVYSDPEMEKLILEEYEKMNKKKR